MRFANIAQFLGLIQGDRAPLLGGFYGDGMPDYSEKIEKAIQNLPSLSPTATKVVQVAHDPNSSPKQVVKIIMLDPVLTAKVLKLINSAFYGMKKEVGSVAQAVVLLGLNTVKNLALSASLLSLDFLRKKYRTIDMDGFWRHSLSTAVGARTVASLSGASRDEVEEFFICGLLHDIGKIVLMAVCPSEFADAVRDANDTHSNLAFSEMQHTGLDHAEAGLMLAEKWKLAENVCEAIENHHHPKGVLKHPEYVHAVCIANNMAKQHEELGFSGNVLIEEVYRELIAGLGLKFDEVEKAFAGLPPAVEKAATFLQISAK